MSVYKKGRFFHYDFVYRGRRYYGSTGQDTRRNAETVERARRLEAATGASTDAGELTLDEAAGKYLDEKDPTGSTDLERYLRVMIHCVGKHRLLREIDAAVVQEAISRRRKMQNPRSKNQKDAAHGPASATVNRDIIDHTLRPLLNRARKVWGAKSLNVIQWKAVRLKEPKGIVREYSGAEVRRWHNEIDDTAEGRLVKLAVELLLTYGLRFGELFFMPSAVDGEGQRLKLNELKGRDGKLKSRKSEEGLTLPLRPEHARMLAAMASTRDPNQTVFPFTYWGLYSRVRSAAARAKLGARAIHGTRHHAATTLLRKTGNLKLAQRMLGHAAIQSTMRYAHANEDDLRAALNELSPSSPELIVTKPRQPNKKKGR